MKWLIILLISTSSYAQINFAVGYNFESTSVHVFGKTSYGLIWANYSGRFSITNFINIRKFEAMIMTGVDTASLGLRYTIKLKELSIQPYYSGFKFPNAGVRFLHQIIGPLSFDLLSGYYRKPYFKLRLICTL